MKYTPVYADLGQYLIERRKADMGDDAIRTMCNAWNRIAKDLPDLPSTPIDEEQTRMFLKRFAAVAENDLKQGTIDNYANAFRRAVDTFRHHIADTGGMKVLQPTPPRAEDTSEEDTNVESAPAESVKRGPLYADLGEYIVAYRDDNPDDDNLRKWVGAYNAIAKWVETMPDAVIDPERTEQLLQQFIKAATPHLKKGTLSHYQFCFRQAVSFYCGVRGLDYEEVSVAERRRRRLEAEREAKPKSKPKPKRARPVADEAPEPVDTVEDTDVAAEAVTELEPVPEPAEEIPDLIEYAFKLRPGMITGMPLPDDLTEREADRISQWVHSFVLDQ